MIFEFENEKKTMFNLHAGDTFVDDSGDSYHPFFIIAYIEVNNKPYYTAVQLNEYDKGEMEGYNYDKISEALFSSIDDLVEYMQESGFTNIRKVNLKGIAEYE